MCGPTPYQSLNAATATGVGATFDLGSSLVNHSLSVVVTGSGSATVALEVSHDGVNFVSITTVSTTTFNLLQGTRTARYVRANLTSLSGGSSPTVTASVASA